MKTLQQALPYEFMQSYQLTTAYQYRDVEVTAEHGTGHDSVRWPGPHKNVHYWVELANGYAVGWNENPGLGWSFPAVKLKKD